MLRVKPKTGLAVGDEFINKAAIYFDYNLPVITNQPPLSQRHNLFVAVNYSASPLLQRSNLLLSV